MTYSIPFAWLLITWLLLILIANKLPAIVRGTNLSSVITPPMIQTIRAVIVAFLIITLVGIASIFISAFIPL